jgi:hypothetical protein
MAAGGLAAALLYWIGVTSAHGDSLRARDSVFPLLATCTAAAAAVPPAAEYRAVRQIRRPRLWVAAWAVLGAFVGPVAGIACMIVRDRN